MLTPDPRPSMRPVSHLALTPTDKALTITADDRDPQAGNMSHDYRIAVAPESGSVGGSSDVDTGVVLHFQHGPIAETGVNGITNEVLLAIVLDRLEGAQSGPFACIENYHAMTHITAASEALAQRTRDRIARGVEGRSEK